MTYSPDLLKAADHCQHRTFITNRYDNEHVPLFKCEVLDSVYDDVLNESGDIHYGYEKHSFVPVSEYSCADSSQLRHIFFTQVQGTVPFNRTLSEYEEVKDNWFLSMDAIRSFIAKTKTASPYGENGRLSDRYGDNLIPFLNYVDIQNYIKRLRKHLFQKLGSYETLHFYAWYRDWETKEQIGRAHV